MSLTLRGAGAPRLEALLPGVRLAESCGIKDARCATAGSTGCSRRRRHPAGRPDLPRFAIRVAIRVDEGAPVELQLCQDPADRAPTYADILLIELERDTRG